MIKLKNIILTFVLLFLTSILVVTSNASANNQSNDINNSNIYEYSLVPYLKIADNIIISKPIDSEAILIGNTVKINSEISGDLFIIADRIEINEKINGDVRVISLSKVLIRSEIIGSFSGIAETVETTGNSNIENHFYGIFSNLVHYGRIGKNLNISLNPTGKSTIGGKVLGAVFYTGNRPILSERGYVESGIYNIPLPESMKSDSKTDFVYSQIFYSLSIFTIYLFILLINKKSPKSIVQRLKLSNLKIPLIGFVSLVMMTGIAFLLFITIIGMPMSLIIIGTLLAIIYSSPIIGAFYISKMIFRNNPTGIIQFLLSLLIFNLISIAPFVGFVISSFTVLFSIGLITDYIFNSKKRHE